MEIEFLREPVKATRNRYEASTSKDPCVPRERETTRFIRDAQSSFITEARAKRQARSAKLDTSSFDVSSFISS